MQQSQARRLNRQNGFVDTVSVKPLSFERVPKPEEVAISSSRCPSGGLELNRVQHAGEMRTLHSGRRKGGRAARGFGGTGEAREGSS